MLNRYASRILAFFTLALFIGCSADDNPLTRGVQRNADPALLEGIWTIIEGTLEGQTVPVPPTSPACGRDYFIYSADGSYSDYVFFDGSSCVPQISNLSWTLNDGVITLRDGSGQSSQLTITQLNANSLVFRSAIDFDQDGDEDIFTFAAVPYDPPLRDNVTQSFQQDPTVQDRIQLRWNSYTGGRFDRYEIYRSTPGNCDKGNTELIASLTEQTQNSFVDENPADADQICYFMRLIADGEQLGESELVTVIPDQLEVPTVMIQSAVASGDQIDVSWQSYTGFYFDRYEIYVRNYENGTTGYAFQEQLVAVIDDKETTSFTDTAPPFVRNPFYEVRVVNTFGNGPAFVAEGGIEVSYQRPGLLDLSFINLMAIDPTDTALYFLGDSANENEQRLVRFDYSTNQTTVSTSSPNTSSQVFLKVIDSDAGKELMLLKGFDVSVYDASTLDFKYELNWSGGFLSVADFDYLGNGNWVFTDSETVYTFSRNNAELTLINQAGLTTTTNAGQFQILNMGNDRILVGHEFSDQSYRFDVTAAGAFQNLTTFTGIRWQDSKETLFYNETADVVLDQLDRGIYETQNFSFTTFFPRPFLGTALSQNGERILGTDNDPEWTIDEQSMHMRTAVFFDINSSSASETTTTGYPLFVFENHLGQQVSISSWFKREGLTGFAPRPDLFVEIVP